MKYISLFFLTQISLFGQTKLKSHAGQHKVVLPIPEERQSRNRALEEPHSKVVRLGTIFFILFPVNGFLSESYVIFLQRQIHSTPKDDIK
jgi:hypothetical protein